MASIKSRIIRFLIGFSFFVSAVIFEARGFCFYLFFGFYVISYLIFGLDVIFEAFENIFHGEVLDENFLMTVASLGAGALGDFKEAVAVMLLYMIGESAQDFAVDSSLENIKKSMKLSEDKVLVREGKGYAEKKPKDVSVGQIIKVLPGEKIPLDGYLISDYCLLDTSALTGEMLPVNLKTDSEVLSGCIVLDSPVEIKVSKSFEESAVSKILDMVEKARENKAPVESFITSFAKIYTPVVVALALSLALIPSLITGLWAKWVYRALEFLVISCPCALVISVPLTFFAGLGCCAKNGIMIKGANFLQSLSETTCFAFDKTGTLTKGSFKVVDCDLDDESLAVLYSLEMNSNHPLAGSVVAFCKERKIKPIEVSKIKEIPGIGLKGFCRKGESTFEAECGRLNTSDETCASQLQLAINGQLKGRLILQDEIKDSANDTVLSLKKMGIEKIIMLTGDRKTIALDVASKLGIDECNAELLPQNKVERILELKKMYNVAFVGDGINDAPVLVAADTGISMGTGAADSAKQASSIVISKDDILKVPFVFGCAKKTVGIAKQNIALAIAVKVVCLGLSAFGICNMSLAVFADVGVCLLCVINSMRALRFNFS